MLLSSLLRLAQILMGTCSSTHTTETAGSYHARDGAFDIVFFGSGGGAGAGVLKKLWASAVETVIRRTGSKCSSRLTRSRNCMRKLLVISVIRWSTLMISYGTGGTISFPADEHLQQDSRSTASSP